MTNGWIDIKNTDMMLIMGGNPAENHPCGFKWAMEAKRNRNAKLISVDPRFTRTSSTADLFCQIRAGADIAFLGGLIRYAIENNRIAKDYLINSSCRRTDSIPGSTPQREPTTRPLGTIRKAEILAARRTPPVVRDIRVEHRRLRRRARVMRPNRKQVRLLSRRPLPRCRRIPRTI